MFVLIGRQRGKGGKAAPAPKSDNYGESLGTLTTPMAMTTLRELTQNLTTQMAQSKKRKEVTLQLPMALEEVDVADSRQRSDPAYAAGRQTAPSSVIPFVKWVGGKRNLIERLKERLPESIRNYYEPFVGGGALFFEIHGQLERAYLSDSNLDLVLTYRVIQKEPNRLVDALRKHAKAHNEEHYYKIRAQHGLSEPIEIAARFIYLNRTCYNGLYRVNQKGEFNVPMGDYANPGIVQENNILACSAALQRCAAISFRDFDTIEPSKDDLVYFDPPYHPTDETSFTAYSKADFTEKDQVRLAEFAKNLHHEGVKVMLSNSNTKFIRELYRSSIFKIDLVNAPRMVNCKPNGRSPVEEVLITNY